MYSIQSRTNMAHSIVSAPKSPRARAHRLDPSRCPATLRPASLRNTRNHVMALRAVDPKKSLANLDKVLSATKEAQPVLTSAQVIQSLTQTPYFSTTKTPNGSREELKAEIPGLKSFVFDKYVMGQLPELFTGGTNLNVTLRSGDNLELCRLRAELADSGLVEIKLKRECYAEGFQVMRSWCANWLAEGREEDCKDLLVKTEAAMIVLDPQDLLGWLESRSTEPVPSMAVQRVEVLS